MKKLLDQIVWLLTAIGALNWGMYALGFGLFQILPYALAPLFYPLQLIIGLCGAYSLFLFFFPMKK